jgi:membrane-associated phospholipid phosphatase
VSTNSPLPDTAPRRRRSGAVVVAAFAAAFVLAVFLDVPLSSWTHDSGLAGWLKSHVLLTHIIRFPGNFYFTLVVCAAMLATAWMAGFRHGDRLWSNAAIVLFAGILSGINAPLKWMVGRIRPYHGVPAFELHPFRFGLVSAEASFSFPSGDASLAFAMAMSLSITVPRLRPLWWTLAVIVAIERIAENAHYPSDVVGGAVLGVAVAVLARWTVAVLTKNDANPPEEIIIPSGPTRGRT